MMENKDIKEYHKMVEKLEKKDTYKPLPDGLIIKKSSIEGQGIFTTKFIEDNIKLGLSHIIVNGELIRTPLGGFVNHSDNPNCIKVRGVLGLKDVEQYNKYFLYTIRDIKAWEELTCKYTFYKVGKKEEENTDYNITAPMMEME